MIRGCVENPICSICGEDSEAVDHALLRCSMIINTWKYSRPHIHEGDLLNTSFRDLIRDFIENSPDDFFTTSSSVRGKYRITVIEPPSTKNLIALQKSSRRLKVFGTSFSSIQTKRKLPTKKNDDKSNKWQKPLVGRLTLNSDVSVIKVGLVSLIYIIKNIKGKLIAAVKKESRQKAAQISLRVWQSFLACRMQLNSISKSFKSNVTTHPSSS